MQHRRASAANGRRSQRKLARGKAKLGRPDRLGFEFLEPRLLLEGLLISELMAVNDSVLADGNGEFEDWIEIYNPTDQTIDLDGWYLTDNVADPTQWRFPAIALAAEEHLVVFASEKDRTDPRYALHTNFRLDGEGEYLALVQPDGATAAHEYTPAYPAQTSDVSYGISDDATAFSVPDGDALSYHVPTADDAVSEPDWMFPEFDDSQWSAYSKTSGILIAEAGTEDPDFVEIQNVSDRAINTDGWVVAANIGTTGSVNQVHSVYWELPAVIAGGQVLYQDDDPAELDSYWGSPINWRTAGYGWVMIVDDFGNVADFVAWGYPADQITSMNVTVNSHQITIGDAWNGDSVAGTGSAGNSLQRHGDTDHDSAADWAFVAPHSPREENADLVTPFGADPAIGFGFDVAATGLDGTFSIDVAELMHGQNASLWTRVPFEVDDPGLTDALQLHVQYNDGFVAYLNGVEIAARNAPEVPGWNSAATDGRTVPASQQVERIELAEYFGVLRAGRNVLAVHGLNAAADDANFLIAASLLQSGNRFFTDPTPGTANGAGFSGLVADTAFSVDRGFYDAPFEVEITTDTPNAQIYYTTDGSLPSDIGGTFYTDPIPINTTTTLRAIALKQGYAPTNVDTQTYIFPNAVLRQSGSMGGFDYTLSPAILGDPVYGPLMEPALQGVPTVSIVTPQSSLFGSTGIYDHPQHKGKVWERAISLELLNPGEDAFQFDAGIRIQGRESRAYTKKSFRLYFRGQYGPGQLEYPLFEDHPFSEGAVEQFDQLILRSGSQDGWFQTRIPPATALYLRNRWTNDLGLSLGNPAAHGRFVHVFLNGVYWGQYHLLERTNAPFFASYEGGDKDNYDVFNESGFLDGDATAWNRTVAIANAGLADPTNYQRIQQFIDVDHYIRYAMVNHYTLFVGWWAANNYLFGRERTAGQTWNFVPVDSDGAYGQYLSQNAYTDYTGYGGPGGLFSRFIQNPEFRIRFADVAHQYLFNDGPMTPGRIDALIMAGADEMATSIVAESARWGGGVYTRDTHWKNTLNGLRTNFFPRRTAALIQQYVSRGLYPNTAAPAFNRHGGNVPFGFELTVDAPQGTIYYTLDGSDPRLTGGGILAGALVFEGEPITLGESTAVKARALHGDEWSAMNEATFLVERPNPLVITEINYHPFDPTGEELAAQPSADPSFRAGDFEFVELQNTGGEPLDLTGVYFADGIDFQFTDGATLSAGEYVVVARNLDAFEARYGGGIDVAGVYVGKLQDGGERIRLSTQLDEVIAEFRYGDEDRWPGRADGKGAALELIDPAGVPDDSALRAAYLNDGDNWHSSIAFGGTPGAEPAADPGIVVNEVLTHTDPPLLDAIELHNTTGRQVDVGGWYLSDSWGWASDPRGGDYRKFRIPDDTPIAAGGYLVFDERDFNPNGLWNPNAGPRADWEFALGGASGDDVWLMEADATGRLTRFADHAEFPAAAAGESFGRYPNATGDLAPMRQRTFGDVNAQPRVGPVVISEVMYHPPAGGDEFIELLNPTGTSVSLFDPARPNNTWRIAGVDFQFPAGVVIPPGGVVLVVPTAPAAFREKYSVASDVQIFGPYAGALNNAGERLRLLRPDEPTLDGVPWVTVDEADYRPDGEWPIEADGVGRSLARLDAVLWGHYANAWQASVPAPGSASLSTGPEVTGRWVFYNNSAHDGSDAAANAQDGAAIATDKTPLLDGQVATSANYTSYAGGLNGVIVDLAGLAEGTTPGVDDFAFRVGNDNRPDAWPLAPQPAVTVRPGEGADGADRVTIVWEDGAIRNRWLQVTVLADRLGRLEDDVFYFGNAVGEAGNQPGNTQVTATDLLLARNNPRNFLDPAGVDFPYDYNRDQRVNATDVLLARNNQTNFLTALKLIDLSGEAMEEDIVPSLPASEAALWLREYVPPSMGSQSSKRPDTTADAVEKLLMSYWP